MNTQHKALPRIVFAGTPDIATVVLQRLLQLQTIQLVGVYTQPDKPVGRGQKLAASPVKQLALEHHIPVFQPESFKNKDAIDTLSSLKPDLLIVIAYGLLLPTAVLNIPALGCINIHTSLLPRWRGAAPIARCLLAGDTITGVTLMRMDAGLDTGPILAQATYRILSDETTMSLTAALAELGATLLVEKLSLIINGTITKTNQLQEGVTYAAKLQKADGLLDWQLSAVTLANQTRALNPWPVAFAAINNETFRIWQANALLQTSDAIPGTIIQINKQGCDVACGDGVLRLEKLQFPGGKILPLADLLNSNKFPLQQGMRLEGKSQ